jgi:metal-dependent hydrolase (beta-lactamase superfamily II)
MLKIGVLGSGSQGNSLIISSGNDAILVDAGFSRKEILKRLEKLEFDPARIRSIVSGKAAMEED